MGNTSTSANQSNPVILLHQSINKSINQSETVGTSRLLMNMYEWEIPYYLYFNSQVGKRINSPTFTIENKSWHLELYPNGKDESSKGYISLYLRMLDPDELVKAQFIFIMIDDKKQVVATIKSNKCVFKGAAQGYGQFVYKNLVLLSMTNLKILCKIITEKAEMPSMMSSKILKQPAAMGCFLNREKFSDVKVIVENKHIFAHKIVLSTQSPVFAAMFEHQMKENQDNIVIIKDISYDVFYELLRYMYSDNITINKNIASELLKASDKYELLNLKKICERKMCENLCIDNTLACLALADTYNASYLKIKAIKFFASHAKEIIHTNDFELLRNFHTTLLRDVFCALLPCAKQ